MTEKPTERVIYTGRVQGVGFRYTVQSLARGCPITGYVRNLSDGSVELVAQGDVSAINALLADVSGRFGANISHCERRPVTDAPSLETFEIRF
ncbi:MAG TPA: acylphosphatase [Planctomycetaceae bacterium]|nr:acylphosphatase [Planctomycetaceae bacterium]